MSFSGADRGFEFDGPPEKQRNRKRKKRLRPYPCTVRSWEGRLPRQKKCGAQKNSGEGALTAGGAGSLKTPEKYSAGDWGNGGCYAKYRDDWVF